MLQRLNRKVHIPLCVEITLYTGRELLILSGNCFKMFKVGLDQKLSLFTLIKDNKALGSREIHAVNSQPPSCTYGIYCSLAPLNKICTPYQQHKPLWSLSLPLENKSVFLHRKSVWSNLIRRPAVSIFTKTRCICPLHSELLFSRL